MLLALALVCAPHALAARGQTPRPAPGGAPPATQDDQRTGAAKLTESEQGLVAGSRLAVLNAGLSGDYFDRHFRLARVVDKAGDRRVVWKFTVNAYQAIVNDAVGFYTEGGRRVDTHSVSGLLAAAHEIEKTITPREAERAMTACIGPHTDGGVTYAAFGAPPRATLMLNGSSVVKPAGGAEKRSAERRREREERERKARRKSRGSKKPAADEGEEEDEGKQPVIYVGVVNLETGKCLKGRAVAGPPQP